MKEVEIKLIGLDEEAFIKQLTLKGATFDCRENQINIRINSTIHPIENPSYLRVRIVELEGGSRTCEFTYKTRKKGQSARINEEHTCAIKDPDELLKILALMGYDVQESGKKIRTRYLYKNYRVEFDHWDKETLSFPYVEVEAESPEALKLFIKEFSIPEEYISTKSIAELKEEDIAKDKD